MFRASLGQVEGEGPKLGNSQILSHGLRIYTFAIRNNTFSTKTSQGEVSGRSLGQVEG